MISYIPSLFTPKGLCIEADRQFHNCSFRFLTYSFSTSPCSSHPPAESRNTPEAGIAKAEVNALEVRNTSCGAWTRGMAPKEEAGGVDRCSTVAAWTTTTNNSGRPPLVASTKSSKLGSHLVTHGTAKTASTTASTPTLRVRPVLKPSTPSQEVMNPVPPKQSPGAISFMAQSSSVVAPLRDGNAACMLFSQADLRLPGTAPLSSRSFHGKGAECGRYTPTCGRAKRTRSTGASNPSRKCDTTWLPSPASDTAIPSTSCSSPPRLAALSPAALKRPTSYVEIKNKPDGGLSGWSAGEDTYCITAAAAMESRGVNKGRLAKTRKHGFESMSPLEKPRIEKTDHMANHRLARDEAQQTRKQKGQAVTPRIDTQEDKTRSLESLKSGAHTGMSVAEFADKVATLAAEVAKVFGRKPVPQSANCLNYGLE